MNHQINPYIAILIVALYGSWVTLTIVQIATTDIFNSIAAGSEAQHNASLVKKLHDVRR